MVQHVSLTASADIHVCKNADTASLGQVNVFNGDGTQTAVYPNPHGQCYFVDSTLAAPYVLTYPSTYTKLAPTTIGGGISLDFTEATTARLTYTGTQAVKARMIGNITLDQTVGANRDIGLLMHKNGSPIAGSEIFTTAPSGLKQLITTIFDVSAAQNDYFEVYAKNFGASGDINIYAFVLTIFCTRG